MRIETIIAPEDVAIGVKATDKAQLIADLAAWASKRLNIDLAEVRDGLAKREELGSTGMGSGIAIPHARLSSVRRAFGVLWMLKRPLEFDAVDEKPVDVVFALLLPAEETGEALNALACAARLLREPDRLKRMRAAADADQLHREVVR